MSAYKDALTIAMTKLGQNPNVRFIGYGVSVGKAMGTLKDVSPNQLIEMPVAENLMVGFAIGLSMQGLLPVVFFERFDFVLNAMDAIVNHLDKIRTIGHNEYNPVAILRIVVGNREKPLFTGLTHTQDYSRMLNEAVSFPVVSVRRAEEIGEAYSKAQTVAEFGIGSTAIVEFKDLI